MIGDGSKKKRRKGRMFRLTLLLILLLIVLLLLFGGQWGIGGGDVMRLISTQISPEPAVETPVDEPQEEAAGYQEKRVMVTGNAIQVENTPYTIEGFSVYLDSLEGNALVVLVDQEANYALFTTLEEMLSEKNIPYVIEE